MIDQLRQMAIFAKVNDHGSFRGAAEDLRLSPSVISHHVSQLEEHLGVALMHRSTRKLRLTQEGEKLLNATHKMIEAIEGELLDLSSLAGRPSGELRITAPSVLAESPFIGQLATFTKSFPHVRLLLDFSDSRREIIDDGIDVAIRMSLQAKNSATTCKLYQVRRKLVGSVDYLGERPKVKQPVDLKDWTWLELAPVQKKPAKFTKKQATQLVHKKQPRVSCNDAKALYQLALAGVGLAIVPEFLSAEDVANGKMAYPLPDWELEPIEVFAHWPANAPRHGLIKLFVTEMQKSSLVERSVRQKA